MGVLERCLPPTSKDDRPADHDALSFFVIRILFACRFELWHQRQQGSENKRAEGNSLQVLTMMAARFMANSIGKAASVRSFNRHLLLSNSIRSMSSVSVLEDLDELEKFSQLNHKSVLYFTATWCPPCKAIKPVYEELATKYKDVAFGKVDVDDNSDAAMEHQISAVPTFIFFDGEDPIERFSGADPSQLESLIKDLESR